MRDEERKGTICRHFEELQARYPELTLGQNLFGDWVVRGPIQGSATYENTDIDIVDVHVEVVVPASYPEICPVTRETTGITKEFHTNDDGALCLGSPMAVKQTFSTDPTLLGYVERLVIPFFYAYFYKIRFGELPFGELSHGGEGLLEYYLDLFGVTESSGVLGLLRILVDDNYRGHLPCPCKSIAIVRNCHGEQLREISRLQSKNDFIMDYCSIAKYCYENSIPVPKECLPKQIVKKLRRLAIIS